MIEYRKPGPEPDSVRRGVILAILADLSIPSGLIALAALSIPLIGGDGAGGMGFVVFMGMTAYGWLLHWLWLAPMAIAAAGRGRPKFARGVLIGGVVMTGVWLLPGVIMF